MHTEVGGGGTRVRTQKTAICKQRRETSEETKPINTWILDFYPLELWGNKVLCPRLWYFAMAALANRHNKSCWIFRKCIYPNGFQDPLQTCERPSGFKDTICINKPSCEEDGWYLGKKKKDHNNHGETNHYILVCMAKVWCLCGLRSHLSKLSDQIISIRRLLWEGLDDTWVSNLKRLGNSLYNMQEDTGRYRKINTIWLMWFDGSNREDGSYAHINSVTLWYKKKIYTCSLFHLPAQSS